MNLTGETPLQAFEPDYRPIDPELEATMIGELINSNEELCQSDNKYAIATISGTSPYSNLARSLEGRVFEHYFDNNNDEMCTEYRPYEDASTFFLVIDREEEMPAGVMRVIYPNDSGLKSVNDINTKKCKDYENNNATNMGPEELYGEFGIDPASAVDVATIAAHPEYGAKNNDEAMVLPSLMHALYRYTIQNGYDGIVAIIDKVPLQKLQEAGLPIYKSPRIAEPFKYMGAAGNSFIYIPVGETEESIRKVNDQVFEFVFGENALGGVATLSLQEQ